MSQIADCVLRRTERAYRFHDERYGTGCSVAPMATRRQIGRERVWKAGRASASLCGFSAASTRFGAWCQALDASFLGAGGYDLLTNQDRTRLVVLGPDWWTVHATAGFGRAHTLLGAGVFFMTSGSGVLEGIVPARVPVTRYWRSRSGKSAGQLLCASSMPWRVPDARGGPGRPGHLFCRDDGVRRGIRARCHGLGADLRSASTRRELVTGVGGSILPRQRRSSCRSDNPVRQAGGSRTGLSDLLSCRGNNGGETTHRPVGRSARDRLSRQENTS